ncbi:hypothetical protein [Mycoplasmopsis adleri]|uniref:hypothetical protein n=1 Tax=Mycoplasmopsis adleri TaxID=51362 RepID=UPI003872BD37
MASYDRDPEACAERIEKRRQLLIKLHEENLYELAHPESIREEDKPINKKCDDPLCKIARKNMSPAEYKAALTIKILAVVVSILVIVTCTLVAVMISKL